MNLHQAACIVTPFPTSAERARRDLREAQRVLCSMAVERHGHSVADEADADIRTLDAMGEELDRHHRRMAELHAELGVSSESHSGITTRPGKYDAAAMAEAEIEALSTELTSEAESVLRAEVRARKEGA